MVDEVDLDARMSSGSAREALIEAKKHRLIRHIGCTNCGVLIQAIERFYFKIILVSIPIGNAPGTFRV